MYVTIGADGNHDIDIENARKILVTVEFELTSGDIGGAYLRGSWYDGAAWWHTYVYIANIMPDLPIGIVQKIEVELEQPTGFVPGSGAYLRVFWVGNSANGNGLLVGQTAISSFQVQNITHNSVAGLTMKAVAQQEGWSGAFLGLGTQAETIDGTAYASLGFFAGMDPDGLAVSNILIDADKVKIVGNLTVTGSMIQDGYLVQRDHDDPADATYSGAAWHEIASVHITNSLDWLKIAFGFGASVTTPSHDMDWQVSITPDAGFAGNWRVPTGEGYVVEGTRTLTGGLPAPGYVVGGVSGVEFFPHMAPGSDFIVKLEIFGHATLGVAIAGAVLVVEQTNHDPS